MKRASLTKQDFNLINPEHMFIATSDGEDVLTQTVKEATDGHYEAFKSDFPDKTLETVWDKMDLVMRGRHGNNTDIIAFLNGEFYKINLITYEG